MRLETKLTLGVAGVLLAGFLAIGLVHTRQEELAFNLRSGEMRLDRFFLGFQYASETIPSNLEWVAELTGPGEDRWIAMSVRDHGSLLRHSSYHRRIGQVYADACTLAKVLRADPQDLRALIQVILDAGYEEIWPLRQALREEFDRTRSAGRATDSP